MEWMPGRVLVPISCGYADCRKAFTPRRSEARYCSLSCASRAHSADRSAIAAAKRALRPTDCSEPDCPNPRKRKSTLCGSCDWKRYVAANRQVVRARYRRKTHARKSKMRYADFTPAQELRIRAAAKRCPLCDVVMTADPYLPHSKELDHIVPLGVGGTHTLGNVRIICRACNLRRPHDGSDYAGPVTLFALEVA